MLITENTKYAELEPVEKYLKEKDAEKIKELAERCLGSMYDLEFATFWACCGGDFSHLGSMEDATVLQVYWVRRFGDFVKEFTQALNALRMPQTSDEKQASNGLLEVTFAEAMLVFMQQWFGLKSYKEAERITLGELLIAKRASYNDAKYKRQLANIQTKRLHAKK